MKKTLIYLAVCTLPISSLRADDDVSELEKPQQDRERLLALVVKLEDDFGKTLKNYNQLQKDYEVLQNDRSAEKAQALLKSDLKALRKELHAEREFAMKAEVQLARLAELEKENGVLVTSLKKEKAVQERSTQEAATLKKNHFLQITQFEEAIAKYRKEDGAQKSAAASLVKLQGEQDSLTNLLKISEQDLQNLRTDLAAEMQRTLEIPLLQTQRTQLTSQLAASHEKAEGLFQKNEALSAKQAELEKEIAKAKQSIAEMKTELEKNVKELSGMEALSQQHETLNAEALQLRKTVETSKEELLQIKADLKESQQSLVAAKQGLADSVTQAKQVAQEKEALVTKQQATEGELLQIKADLKERQESLATAKQDLADSMAQVEQVSQEKEELVTTQQAELAEVRQAILKQEEVVVESETLNMQVEELTVEKEALLAELGQEKLTSAEAAKNLEVAQTELMKSEEIGLKFTESQTANEQLTATLFETQNLLKATEAVEKDLELAQKKEATLMTELATLKKAKGALSEQMTQRDQDLKKEQAARVKEVKGLQDEKTKLTGNIAKLTFVLKQTRKELGELDLKATATEKELDAMKRASVQVAPVLYARGEADVSTQQARVLAQIQKVLELFPDAHFEIIGHTCDLGSPESNLRLSEQRAQALSDYLVEKGISQDALKSRGVGHTEPKVENTSEANRRQNRRVVVEILD